MQNIELKVMLESLEDVRKALVNIGARKEATLRQVDTYFNVEKGRLKMREINDEKYELIYYERPDESESKVSTYTIENFDSVGEAKERKKALTQEKGVMVVVSKERELWIYKHTRVHLDTVDNLGTYLELETVVEDIAMQDAEAEHAEVIALLDLNACKKCEYSYSDMLLDSNRTS